MKKNFLVKENLYDFQKSGDIGKSLKIGKDSIYVKETIMEELKKLGVHFYLEFGEPEERRRNKERILESIDKFWEAIEALHDIGVEYSDISISYPDSLEVKGYQLKKGNWVILSALTEEDCNLISKVLSGLYIDNGTQDFEVDKQSMTQFIYFLKKGVMEKIKNTKKWREDIKTIIYNKP